MKRAKQQQKNAMNGVVQSVLIIVLTIFGISPSMAAPSADLWPKWQEHNAQNDQRVDHTIWGIILEKYLVTSDSLKNNRFRYGSVSKEDRESLQAYLEALQKVIVTGLSRDEQKAYWLNLYNAQTVEVILDHYPVKSIMDIDISPAFFKQGPWGAKLVSIEGALLSLNDIEHRILRPIFNDNRVHYGLNCASIGCPNLQKIPFTSANMDELLDQGAREYINHPRGGQAGDKKIQVSSIYKWFQSDFGSSEAGVVEHLLIFADKDLARTLSLPGKRLSYGYDWDLNE